jgi:hypothetical protein
MLLPVLEPPVTFQIHATIFAQERYSSMGKVCPTARFEKRPLITKVKKKIIPKKSRF